jgi:ABC-type proline/glycine betaine transport system substrate-binding protein
MIKDLVSDIKALKGLFATISTSTTTTGSIIDTAPYKSMTVVIAAVSWTDGSFLPALFEDTASAMGTESAIDDGNMIPQTTPEASATIDAANEVHTIGLIGTKRYVRLKIVSSGVSSGAIICALFIGEALDAGVTQG